jgi:long-subunit fatty acid transport protein
MGRGGAYAAAVDEPSAIYYNPAALSLIDGFALTLNANLWFYDLTFQRADFSAEVFGQEQTYPMVPAENENAFFPAPMLFLSHDLGLEDFGFGLAVYGPSSVGERSFNQPDLEVLAGQAATDETPRDWGHGYLVESSELLLFFAAAAVSYDFGDLQVGLTLQLASLNTTFKNAADGGGFSDAFEDANESPSLYTKTTLIVSGLAPSGVLGLRYQATPELTFALSYRPRIEFEADGFVEMGLPVGVEPLVEIVDDGSRAPDDCVACASATLLTTIPDVVRFGARYAFVDGETEVADIELDLVYEAWSEMEAFQVDVDGHVLAIGQTRAIPQIIIPKGFDDTLSIRLGGDVRVNDDLTVRAGAYLEGAANGEFFSQGSTRPGFANIDFTPFSRVALSVGGSYRIGDFSLDLALMHVFPSEVVESDGQVPILYPLWICNDPQTDSQAADCDGREAPPHHSVNNGVYNAGYDLISVGFTVNIE